MKKEIAGLQLQYVPTGVSATFFMNNGKPPFNDGRIRRAVSLVTDRQAAMEVIMQGGGELVAYISGREFRFPKEELLKLPGFRRPKDQDIAEAKKLMAEAGFPKGFKTSIISRNTKEQMDIAVFMSGELAKLGIEASVEPLESGIQFERFTKGAYEAGSYRGLTSDNPDLSFAEWLITGSIRGWSRYSNPKVDALFEKQRIATDPVERKKMVQEMERMVLEDIPFMNLYEIVDATIIWPEVRGYKQRSSFSISPLQWQDVWLAK